ncbi:uncharacterized protein LOC124451237 [Xenia sp. Carnegie-2017]|uniref:uncharacterized protein LOC124451237 n=1 Tax=Xenia sp. Carnegie-2017 TaxID=2897299 RepID=UPI001F04AE55|nr:uncharacterized protein LOC124451237 [Xenia sp. Carnegie-2017]
MASGTAPNNRRFLRAATILETINEENLYEIFVNHEYTDEVLNCIETQSEMRDELQDSNISKGAALKFTKQWFKQKTSPSGISTKPLLNVSTKISTTEKLKAAERAGNPNSEAQEMTISQKSKRIHGAIQLDDLYRIEKNKWEVVIRTQGKSQPIKATDVNRHVKNTLTKKYNEWKEEKITNNKTSSLISRLYDNMKSVDVQVLSTNVRNSLKDLNFKENSFILIANKVPQEYRDSNILAFLKMIPWLAVFDLFDIKTEKDGLYFIVNETNDRAKPIKKELHDFSDSKKNEELLKVDTTWITRGEEFHEKNWTRYSKDSLYKALSAFCDCPTGHPHCVFLLMSDTNLKEMACIIEASFSIIQGNDAHKHISVISEKKELRANLTKLLDDDINKDIKPPCSVFGVPMNVLKSIIMELIGEDELEEPDATVELPYIHGHHRPVLNKRIKSLTDLDIYLPRPPLSKNLEEIKKAKKNFYMGNAISQLNLFYRDAIDRTLETKLSSRIDEHLRNLSSLESFCRSSDDEFFVETVTMRYESGSGATTLGRQILWKKRDTYRCAVVKKITDATHYHITQLQKFLYETSDFDPLHIPPVLVFVDNFSEQQVHRLSDKLMTSKTKCLILNTVPVGKQTNTEVDDFLLGKLDDTEKRLVLGVLNSLESTFQNERITKAAKVLDREGRFMWLGLELFGREYADIEKRLEKHIDEILLSMDQLKEAYRMILHFCCLLDYYNKRRSIFPQPCVEVILSLKASKMDTIHEQFGGLLLEDFNESVGYYGWRPAHSLVGEVVREKIDLFNTAKKLMEQIKNKSTYVNKYLTEDIVTVFLQREKISESLFDDNDSDNSEDELVGILEVRTRYSQLILDVLSSEEVKNVRDAFDLLIMLNETVETTQLKARTLQQISRMFAYEIGMSTLSEELFPIIERLNKIVKLQENLLRNGFDIAHRIIDQSIKMQPSYLHHVVTKATFYRSQLKYLHENVKRKLSETDELKFLIEEAIDTTRKGIDLYDDTLKTSNRDSYLHAMIGKIHTIVVVVEMFKNLPHFLHHDDGPDESYREYLTFHKHPKQLRDLIQEENLDYFIFLTKSAVQAFNDFFGEIKFQRKLSFKKHEMKELENAQIRLKKLRTKFYKLTNLDRTSIEQGSVLNEDIVYDLLYKHHENPFSSWARLTSQHVEIIYILLKDEVQQESSSHNAMLTFVKAAIRQDIDIDTLSKMVQSWCKRCPKSSWAHMFNYMIHFPTPKNSLKTDVNIVKKSVSECRIKIEQRITGLRRSGAEYLLGKGIGARSIISPDKVVIHNQEESTDITRSRDTQYWRSKTVYDKLERLVGKKSKPGVLTYRDIEIPFDNDRYPQISRDDLWFCLGFTITGPYAYDPIVKDTYDELQKQFELKQNSAQKGDMMSEKAWPKHYPTRHKISDANNATKKQSPKPILDIASGTVQPQEGNDSKPEFSSSSNISENRLADIKKNSRYRKTVRTPEGNQLIFHPVKLSKGGKIQHGAVVQGAKKSVECHRHTLLTGKDFPPNCTFAHSWKNDPKRQTICEICTKRRREKCWDKNRHKAKHYDLGPYEIIRQNLKAQEFCGEALDIHKKLQSTAVVDTKKEIQEECETDDSSESEDEDENIADFKKKFLDENCKIRPEVWKKKSNFCGKKL